jgi:hypothetical protein
VDNCPNLIPETSKSKDTRRKTGEIKVSVTSARCALAHIVRIEQKIGTLRGL